MRICIVVSHADFLATAGVRIRYRRLEAAFAVEGHALSVISIDQLAARRSYEFDVFVFSKTYSALAQILMRRLRTSGKTVGFDLFDDYFSQAGDARLLFFRDWLTSCGPLLDFAICSTPVLERFLARQRPDLATLVLPDVASELDVHRVDAVARAKIEKAKASRQLDVLWFGIGDNPYFEVGLADLAAYGEELTRLRRRRWDVRLTILTNEAALTNGALMRLARLDVPYQLQTWSEEAESAALATATLCFLPVNAQSFSRSKSLNRAISALSSGCQVLAPGFPLYAELGGMIHATTEGLVEFLERDDEERSAGRLTEVFGRFANPYANARAFCEFIGGLPRAFESPAVIARAPEVDAPDPVPDIAILHGVELDVQAHKAAEKFGALSVRSPLTEAPVAYDMLFGLDASDALRVGIRPNRLIHLQPRWYQAFDDAETVDGCLVHAVSHLGLPDLPRHVRIALRGDTIAGATVLYRSVLEHTSALCSALLDGFTIFVSDRSKIARSAPLQAARLAS